MATQALGRARLNTERLFFASVGLAVLAAMLIGFAPSYFLRGVVTPPHPFEPLTPLVHLHALVFASWVLLFVAQTSLVAAGRVDLHRKLGLLGFGLIALMIPLGLAVAIYGIGRPLTAPPGIDPRSWAATPLLDIPVFGGLIVAGLLNRRRPQVHKRLMLIAMIDMLQPTLARAFIWAGWPVPAVFAVMVALLALLMAWDVRTRGRVMGATAIGSAAVVTRLIGTPIVWTTPAWMSLAGWLHSLA